jgi:hypothetical protein
MNNCDKYSFCYPHSFLKEKWVWDCKTTVSVEKRERPKERREEDFEVGTENMLSIIDVRKKTIKEADSF